VRTTRSFVRRTTTQRTHKKIEQEAKETRAFRELAQQSRKPCTSKKIAGPISQGPWPPTRGRIGPTTFACQNIPAVIKGRIQHANEQLALQIIRTSIVLAAAAFLGFTAVAEATDDFKIESNRQSEGFSFHYGPLGQYFGTTPPRPAPPQPSYDYGLFGPYRNTERYRRSWPPYRNDGQHPPSRHLGDSLMRFPRQPVSDSGEPLAGSAHR
jgi:hypothetical protein